MTARPIAPIALSVWLILLLYAPARAGERSPAPSPRGEIARIRRVIDGDTVVRETGARVRYIGVDTPEIKHPRRPVECLGKEASALNRKLVEGKRVLLVRDVSRVDRYGRQLRYVYLLDREGRPSTLVNEELVRRGLARVRFYPPDVRERPRIRAAQRRARRARRGIWRLPPSRPRGKRRGMVLADPLAGVYHRPGAQGYEDLRCRRRRLAFPSARAAERAGFRAAPSGSLSRRRCPFASASAAGEARRPPTSGSSSGGR
ncbi:MAG: thermonuclease family protein [bacterium]